MKVTEQIDAMEVSGTDPFKFLVVTRVVSTTLMLPVLVVLADGIATWASFIGVNIKDSVSWSHFHQQVFDSLVFSDFLPAFIKSFFFGFSIGIVDYYKGGNTKKGTEAWERLRTVGWSSPLVHLHHRPHRRAGHGHHGLQLKW